MNQTESDQDIVDNIESLNAQTRLLAFNVMMEAVRSGHEAKGFAHVARDLSALTQNATNTVHSLTQETLDRDVLMAAALERNIKATEELRDSFETPAQISAEIIQSPALKRLPRKELNRLSQDLRTALDQMIC